MVDASANGIEMVIKANEKLGDSCSAVELCLALDRAGVCMYAMCHFPLICSPTFVLTLAPNGNMKVRDGILGERQHPSCFPNLVLLNCIVLSTNKSTKQMAFNDDHACKAAMNRNSASE